MNPADYLSYCETDKEREIITALMDNNQQNIAAKLLGVNNSTVSRTYKRIRDRAATQGFAPGHDLTHTVPDGFKVKGVSTYYNADGKPVGQWVKSTADRERQAEIMREAIQGFVEDLPQLPHRELKTDTEKDLLTIYPIGDAHIGMRATSLEAGGEWDLEIAERVHCSAMRRLVELAPDTEKAVIVNLGDWFHFDNMEGVTSRRGHILDTAGTYAEQAKVAVKVMRQLIETALTKHEEVKVINVIGNHDDVSSIMLNIALIHVYENEPRVIVDEGTSVFNYFSFGRNLIGTHHGHSTKHDRLPGIMAADKPELWGSTNHRRWLCGHHHSRAVKEYSGCTVEVFPILGTGDRYSTGAGYRSQRAADAIVLHKEHGEVSRITVNPAMFEN